MPGKLTTHVLDTSHGRPAVGMTIELYRFEREGWSMIKTVTTNNDGRTDEAMLDGAQMVAGVYEMVFRVGDFFANREATPFARVFLTPYRFASASPTPMRIITSRC